MAHESQERYSNLVLAKMRDTLVLKDGIVFNNDYEGKPTAGAVKIPVRDTEVSVSDYDKANGITATTGSTTYQTLTINKDKAVGEIIDGYDAEAVPDNLVADRLDSAGYALAKTVDTDGATVLLAGGAVYNSASVDATSIYDLVVDVRKEMSKANVPTDGRYLLATPDAYALLLKDKDHFVGASALGDKVKQTGAVGKIAGFTVYEFNDNTANLLFIAGHPRYATRVKEFSVPVQLEDLKDGKHIGASWVNGRMVYAHKVLRSSAIRNVYSPGSLTASLAQGSTDGTTIATISAGNTGTTYQYKVNPATRATYNQTSSSYGGTSLTSGTTEIAASAGNVNRDRKSVELKGCRSHVCHGNRLRYQVTGGHLMYAAYTYYSTVYGGAQSAADYARSGSASSDYIASITFDRITDDLMASSEELATNVKRCCCKIADALHLAEQSDGKTSEKVGSYSVSYAQSSQTDAKIHKYAALYLARYGLLYRGCD